MAKFYGQIGYGEQVETSPGIWEYNMVEKNHYGDILRNNRRWDQTENVNDDLVISNRFSIVLDAYASNNFYAMKYVKWMGCKWKITNVEIERPRIIISVGGVYNG